MKHSIKRQMAGIFISVLAAAFLCVGLINAFFLKDYYMSEKKKAVVSAYEALNPVSYTHLQIAESMEKSPKSIDNALQRIRRKIKKFILK